MSSIKLIVGAFALATAMICVSSAETTVTLPDACNQKESIKISIRFMTNELRADALNIKIFNRNCLDNLFNCKVTESSGVLITELKREILKKAAIYQKQDKEKKKK